MELCTSLIRETETFIDENSDLAGLNCERDSNLTKF